MNRKPAKGEPAAAARPTSARRPSIEDIPAVFEMICEGKSLREACRTLGLHAPSTNTFIRDDEGLREQYARAQELRAEFYADEGLSVARAAMAGRTIRIDGAERKLDHQGVRNYLDFIKWTHGRMAPKAGPVQRVQLSYEDLSDSDIDDRIAALLNERDFDEAFGDDEPSTEH